MKSVYAIESPLGVFYAEEQDGQAIALHLPGLPHPLSDGAPQTNLARELGEYFSGKRREFTVPIKLSGPAFFQRALRSALAIPYGGTVTYAALAAAAGSGKAVRAAGQAMAKNPLPVLIPCHRVLYSQGKKQQYAGGPEMKAFLLELEKRNTL